MILAPVGHVAAAVRLGDLAASGRDYVVARGADALLLWAHLEAVRELLEELADCRVHNARYIDCLGQALPGLLLLLGLLLRW